MTSTIGYFEMFFTWWTSCNFFKNFYLFWIWSYPESTWITKSERCLSWVSTDLSECAWCNLNDCRSSWMAMTWDELECFDLIYHTLSWITIAWIERAYSCVNVHNLLKISVGWQSVNGQLNMFIALSEYSQIVLTDH